LNVLIVLVLQSSTFDGWTTIPEGDGDLAIHNTGADGTATSIKHVSRTTINSGPGQSIETGCFVRDQFYEIEAKIMLLDASGNATSCDKSAGWNDPLFCPLFSIWGNHGETGWDNFWFDVPNNDTSTWVAGSFNVYHAVFQVTDELMTATEASFVFRGLPVGVQVIVDSVYLTPYNHEPGYMPDGWGLYEFDFFASSSTFEVNPYSQSTW